MKPCFKHQPTTDRVIDREVNQPTKGFLVIGAGSGD